MDDKQHLYIVLKYGEDIFTESCVSRVVQMTASDADALRNFAETSSYSKVVIERVFGSNVRTFEEAKQFILNEEEEN